MDEIPLFFHDNNRLTDKAKHQPLAQRLRPSCLERVVGQTQILGERSVLAQSIINDSPFSAIFYGPPGTGKTTVAAIIAQHTNARFVSISAVSASVKEIKKIIEEAEALMRQQSIRTIIFIDEIHRFNKAQQDVLLPAVENGTICLIGATTENPFFEINAPLLSRTRIFRFEALTEKEIKAILTSAITDTENGLGGEGLTFSDDAIEFIANIANGDARAALNILELSAYFAKNLDMGQVDISIVKDASQMRIPNYDKSGDQHYDVISAFIKSMRGSDPNAAVFWLVRMLEAGEDPRFIARRMVVFASEDIGNADPHALSLAVSSAHAVDFVGLPEARINLAHAAIYLASAPKSNAIIRALSSALRDFKEKRSLPVPGHLRSSGYKGAKELGHGTGYIYPHSCPDNDQIYFPDEASASEYYKPNKNGEESIIAERLQKRKEPD